MAIEYAVEVSAGTKSATGKLLANVPVKCWTDAAEISLAVRTPDWLYVI